MRYKKDISYFTGDTSVIHNLQLKEYSSKNNPEDLSRHIGLIAEEVYAIDDKLTFLNSQDIVEGIDTNNLMWYMLKEIQKLRQDVNKLLENN